MMPQKKNADTLELIRGKAAAAVGNLTGLLTLLKGLPLAYNRDLQDDKRFALPVAAATRQTLAVAAGIVRTARVRTDRIAGRLEEGFLDATALAEYLTGRGVPFREAHGVVGRLVARAESDGRTLAQMPLEDLRAGSAAIEDDVYGHLGAENVVRRYRSAGSGGVRQVREQIARWRDALGS
jgi:argininosuccinate lyase